MRFSFRRDLALGRYVPLDTIVHRLDPRAKLISFAAALVLLFATPAKTGLLVTLLLAAALGAARVPPRLILSSIRSLSWVLSITFLYQALWMGPRHLGGIAEGAIAGAAMMMRLVGMILAVTLLMFTTEPIRLADGLGRLFGFLERLRIPVRDLTLVLTLALRFLPTVMEEAERIVSAQRARGARFDGGLLARARSLIPLAVPLFASCLRRADTLAMAMTARGYRPGALRTQMEPLVLGLRDLVVIAVALSLTAICLLPIRWP
jgi:energy-coupling factor transport system permease protein